MWWAESYTSSSSGPQLIGSCERGGEGEARDRGGDYELTRMHDDYFNGRINLVRTGAGGSQAATRSSVKRREYRNKAERAVNSREYGWQRHRTVRPREGLQRWARHCRVLSRVILLPGVQSSLKTAGRFWVTMAALNDILTDDIPYEQDILQNQYNVSSRASPAPPPVLLPPLHRSVLAAQKGWRAQPPTGIPLSALLHIMGPA